MTDHEIVALWRQHKEVMGFAHALLAAERERLAQPEQEPIPSTAGPEELWLQLHGDSLPDEPVDFTDDSVTWCWHQIFDSDVRYVRADLAAPQPVQEPWPDELPGHIAGGVQEPVAWYMRKSAQNANTTPQPRRWVGLTDEEKSELDAEYGDDTLAHLDAIEAKLRQKNTYETPSDSAA